MVWQGDPWNRREGSKSFNHSLLKRNGSSNCLHFFLFYSYMKMLCPSNTFFKSLFFKTILTSHYTIMAQLLNVIINLTHPGANSNRPCQASEKAAGLGPFLPLFIIQCPGFSCFYLPLPALNSEPQLPGLGVFGHDSSLVIFH